MFLFKIQLLQSMWSMQSIWSLNVSLVIKITSRFLVIAGDALSSMPRCPQALQDPYSYQIVCLKWKVKLCVSSILPVAY